MPGTRCAVFGCNNSFVGAKAKKETIHFFAFPKSRDSASHTLRNKWINGCKRQGNFNPDNARICSVHFSEDDFERDLKNELLGLPVRKILKKKAVPTLHLSCTSIEHSQLIRHKKAVEQDLLAWSRISNSQGVVTSDSESESTKLPVKRLLKKKAVPTLNLPSTSREEESLICRTNAVVQNHSTSSNSDNSQDIVISELESENTRLPVRKILKRKAVPTLNLPSTSREEKQLSQQKNAVVQDFLMCNNNKNPQDVDISDSESENTSTDYKKLYNKLSVKYDILNSNYLKLKHITTSKIRALKEQLRYYKNKVQPSKSKKSNIRIVYYCTSGDNKNITQHTSCVHES